MPLTADQKQYAINQFNDAASRARRDFVGQYFGTDEVKHNKSWQEYGYPEQITPWMLWHMYRRHPLAHAAIDKRADKKWQTMPEIVSGEIDDKKQGRDKERDQFESEIDKLAQRVNLWQKFKEVEKRSAAGRYAVGVMLLKDGLDLDQPYKRKINSPHMLKKIIPIWSAQINHVIFENNPKSDRFLEPLYFNISQRNTDGANSTSDNYVGITGNVHYSRVIYDFWGVDDDIDQSYSLLEAGYNDLLDTVKIAGAGAEGHWKNAARQLGFEFDKEAQISEIAAGLGVADDEVADALNDQVADLNNNLDSATISIGGKTTPLVASVPDSKDKYDVSANNFAASCSMPYKELIGNQTGERSSSEDANSWHMTCEAERNEITCNLIRKWIQQFIDMGLLPDPKGGVFGVAWASLLDPSPAERLERAHKMTLINKDSLGTGVEVPFSKEEIRTEGGFDNEDIEDSGEDGEGEI